MATRLRKITHFANPDKQAREIFENVIFGYDTTWCTCTKVIYDPWFLGDFITSPAK